MNCGTGEDAVHIADRGVRVLATDISAEMLALASRKIQKRGLSHLVETRQLRWEDLDMLPEQAFDGALSNFGGLNCVQDLESIPPALARRLRPGNSVFLCVMGPFAVWEWIWFGLRFQPGKATRRLRRNVQWRGISLRYPSPAALGRLFSASFRIVRVSALGALLPPPFAEKLVAGRPGLAALLNRWERRVETLPPLPSLADHYLMEMERV